MNLFILAAGTGRRMYPLTKDIPKSLLDLGDGSTLLDKQLTLALENDKISQIYIITGYKNEHIEQKAEEYNQSGNIHCVYNPFYDVSNNLMSLWCTHHHFMDRDFIITNGDNIYKPGVFEKITAPMDDGIYVTIDYKDHYDDDDMKVCIQGDTINRISKKIEVEKTNAESVGLVRLSGEESRSLFQRHLLGLIKEDTSRDAFWLEIFNSLALQNETINPLIIDQHDWGEMDFHPDIEQMKQAITKNIF
ncbi:MAG: NTP transferase domain-containing protein [Gammaproteobacteria bacterium]|nr:NTP transferase domain-containing protein [Gammaproteobacteria bacterium]